jgi:hypothetical protein
MLTRTRLNVTYDFMYIYSFIRHELWVPLYTTVHNVLWAHLTL